MSIDLLQPRHTYAPEEGMGAPYLPGALTNLAARLLATGQDVRILDGNFPEKPEILARLLGVNVVGAPYLPELMDLQRQLGRDIKLVLGGQVIDGLSPNEKERLFGSEPSYGEEGLFLHTKVKLPARESVSTVPAYRLIPDRYMQEYLSPAREISFYLSQGCVYRCTFCAADKNMQEKYRDMETVEEDLSYLMDRAIQLGHNSLSMYLSNLDLFQTPGQLEEFAQIVIGLKASRPGFVTRLRGLSTAHMLLKADRERPSCIEKMKEAGLWTVGIGVDGVNAETWRAVKKGHNSQNVCTRALTLLADHKILPEAFMVLGHPSDTAQSLREALAFLKAIQGEMDVVPRPYVAKSFVPRNDGWRQPEFSCQREKLLQDPAAFQSLDYAAYPSRLTHPHDEQRGAVRHTFDEICNLPRCTTVPVEPVECGMTPEERLGIKKINIGRYDR